MRSKNMDMQGLKRLYAKNRSAQALFQAFSWRNDPGDARASVDSLLGWLVAAQQRVPRAELIGILRALQSAGCGRFVTGRRGQPSRFAWKVAPASVAQAITGVVPTRPEPSKPVSTDPATQMMEHVYRLRRDLTISVRLPPDLTLREAQRLGDFVRTLSFDEGARPAGSSESF